MQTISDRASSATWTAQVVTRGGRLPDLERLFRTVRAVGDPFWLRGVEATVDGVLIEREGRPAVKLSGTGEVLLLARLQHKVQWDVPHNREQAITDAERQAYARLVEERARRGGGVTIVGPLVRTASGQAPAMEVRQFTWQAGQTARR